MATITYKSNGEAKEAIIVTAETDIEALLAPYTAEENEPSSDVWIEGKAPLFTVKTPIKLIQKRAVAYCIIPGQPDEFIFKVGENAYRLIRFNYGKQVAASQVYTKANFKRIGWERFTSNTAWPKYIFQA